MLKRLTSILILLLAASIAEGASSTTRLLAKAWPQPAGSLERLGEGVAIVFTPDLSVKDNCRFYTALGFTCFDTADWLEVINGIHAHNGSHRDRPIRTIVLETHGTNGHGLKLQDGKKPADARSYISVGALQEWLEPVGVRHILISACNSGRLLRPEIYRRLNRDPGDKLFLPPTRGIFDATDSFDPRMSRSTVITPASSQIETTLVGGTRELAPATRQALQDIAATRGITLPKQFAISEMLIQILLRDPELRLRTGAHIEDLSDEQTSVETSERLFKAFLAHLNFLAARDTRLKTPIAVGAR